MTPKLIEPATASNPAREIPVKSDEFLIGRGADCDLRVHEAAVSRHHCIVRVRQGEAILVDLGSINGSFVNGMRVRSQTTLHTGDEIRIGSSRFWIDLGDEPDFDWDSRFNDDPLANTIRVRDMQRERKQLDGNPPDAAS